MDKVHILRLISQHFHVLMVLKILNLLNNNNLQSMALKEVLELLKHNIGLVNKANNLIIDLD